MTANPIATTAMDAKRSTSESNMNKLRFRIFVAFTLLTAPIWFIPAYIVVTWDEFSREFVDLYTSGWKAFKMGHRVTQGD
jgi:hypothetical protein